MGNAKIEKQIIQCETQVLGYVPVQVMNLSLEELSLEKRVYIGVASPITIAEIQTSTGCDVRSIQREVSTPQSDFEEYLQHKLAHLQGKDCEILGPVLRRHKHLFYGLHDTKLGCTSQVENSIETGDASPIKRNPYRTPHALKPVVDKHIDEMLEKRIIEPSISPWSSSILLLRKKSTDGTVKYTFCIEYLGLNAVTKPDAYPIPSIVDNLDSLGQSKIFRCLIWLPDIIR
jgi:hypothetical protein